MRFRLVEDCSVHAFRTTWPASLSREPIMLGVPSEMSALAVVTLRVDWEGMIFLNLSQHEIGHTSACVRSASAYPSITVSRNVLSTSISPE